MFILIHSPLVRPLTWALVAEELRQRGYGVIVPELTHSTRAGLPYWQQHANAVAQAVGTVAQEEPPILVAHSGGGMLLPAIRQAIGRRVAAYIFVDAGIPSNGQSRLDLFGNAQAAEQFRQAATQGFLPVWSDEDLREAIPDDGLRQRFLAELRPLPLAVYEEPIPVFPGWPDAPCAFLAFGDNPAYAAAIQHARQAGWEVAQVGGDHFQMLVDPAGVTNALLALVQRLGVG